MITLLTSTTAFDSLGEEANLPFSEEFLGLLDFNSLSWFYLDSITLGLRLRIDAIDGNPSLRSQKFRNPTLSSLGYIAIQSEGYTRDSFWIDTESLERWYYSPAVAIQNNYKNRVSRFGRELSEHNDVAINVQPSKVCGIITTNEANLGSGTTAFLDSTLPIGAFKTYSYRGEDVFQEIPPSQAPDNSLLTGDLKDFGLPDSYSGIIHQDVTIALTLDVFALVVTSGYVQPPLPLRVVGTPQLPAYVHLCDSGTPQPLPTNPTCNPADFGPQLPGTASTEFGCFEVN